LDKFDVVIIGSGPGGYVAAIRAGQLGLKTAIIEKDPKLGGTCLHRGCIPTKAMLFSAELLDRAREAERFGLRIPSADPEIAQIHTYKDGVVTKNANGVEFLMRKNKVTWLKGLGKLVGPGRISVVAEGQAETVVETKHVILATGSTTKSLPGLDFDGKAILSSDHILKIDRIPKRMAVLGAGAVGVEFASAFRSYGTEVSIIEVLPSLLPIEDEDCGKELLKSFRRRKIDCYLGSKLEKLERVDKGVKLTVASSDGKVQQLEADFLLSAVGRRPVTDGVGLDRTRIKPDARGFIQVDGMMQTSEPGIYAIGDIVANTPMLAHVASAEGIVAVEHIAGLSPKPLNYDQMPSCTYCSPQVATVGLSEKKAKERGYTVKTGVFPFSALPKAGVLLQREGMAKIVADAKYDEFLGIHMVGPEVTDLVAEAGVALKLESTVEEIAHTVHAHPTLSEIVGEAAHATLGMPIHI
jgi:dihydrolipoamide dehydrogenase